MVSLIATARRLPSWLLACLLIAGAAVADPLVYRVVADGTSPSYLVGTMHSEDPRVVGRVDALTPLIARVDRVVIEVIPDAAALLATTAYTLLPARESLRDLLGETRFAAVQRVAAERGLPVGAIDRLKPWAVAVMLGMPAADSGRFLDVEIYLEGMRQGRELVGLETAAEQLGAFDALPVADQVALLEAMVNNADALPLQLEELTLAYLDGDLEALEGLARSHYVGLPVGVADWFEQTLLIERNQRMVERLLPMLAEGPLLVAVGALHLGGPAGLVHGLRSQGFTVERWPRDGDP
jgi:uncharacterized protein YbaP (TraB family)